MLFIDVTTDSSREVGGCNGCLDHSTAEGTAEHKVWIISLRGVSVRVCETCKAKLLELLGSP